MPEFIGIDTSNYTTSAAVFVSEEKRIYHSKKLLPVKEGELGLRQSDAVFHHTKQLPEISLQFLRQHVREIQKVHICHVFCAEKELQDLSLP